MDIDGSELAIRQAKGPSSPATAAPASPASPASPGPPPAQAAPPPPTVTLVAADELREPENWKPTPFNAGPAFKTLEWSADGTTVVALTASKTILSYVLPTDLLAPRPHDDVGDAASRPPPAHRHHSIQPQGRLRFGSTPLSTAVAPYFSLAAPWTQTVLVGCPDKPLQLFPLSPQENLNNDDGPGSPAPIASYSLIKHETEAYMPPCSLAWPAPGTHFVVGTNNLLALFDISRTSGDPPVLRVPTTASLYAGARYGLGVSGNVSALAAAPANASNASSASSVSSLTAAGTWTRGVGLYDLARAGRLASHWSLRDGDGDTSTDTGTDGSAACGGGGVVQLLWSPCGRYLVVNERKSTGLLVYDVRGTHRRLATLTERSNATAKPIRCAVYGGGGSGSDSENNDSTFELWSGTDDGSVVMYENIGRREGAVAPTFRWQAHDRGTSVASTAMHASGSVLATCGVSPPVAFSDSESESESGSESESESESESSSGEDDDNDVGEDGDEDESSDDSDDSDDSNDSDDSDSRSPAPARRLPRRARIADPSIKIWSLVPLQSC